MIKMQEVIIKLPAIINEEKRKAQEKDLQLMTQIDENRKRISNQNFDELIEALSSMSKNETQIGFWDEEIDKKPISKKVISKKQAKQKK